MASVHDSIMIFVYFKTVSYYFVLHAFIVPQTVDLVYFLVFLEF